MKLLDVREATAPIRSEIRNAYVDFSEMTVSVVAVEAETQQALPDQVVVVEEKIIQLLLLQELSLLVEEVAAVITRDPLLQAAKMAVLVLL